jgi:hypothetical protein
VFGFWFWVGLFFWPAFILTIVAACLLAMWAGQYGPETAKTIVLVGGATMGLGLTTALLVLLWRHEKRLW